MGLAVHELLGKCRRAPSAATPARPITNGAQKTKHGWYLYRCSGPRGQDRTRHVQCYQDDRRAAGQFLIGVFSGTIGIPLLSGWMLPPAIELPERFAVLVRFSFTSLPP